MANENPDKAKAATGNASNPSPEKAFEATGESQLLGKNAERYLREAGNIEDMPDAQDQQDMDETLTQKKD